LRATWPALIAGLNRAGLGPLAPELSGTELRRAGLAAVGEVVGRLGVEADHVIFGHTHRAGPLPDDEPAEWMTSRPPSGPAHEVRSRTVSRLINAGCWVREPAFTGPDPAGSPYRAGFCVVVQDTEGKPPPALRNLLDADGATAPPRG
ncbi:MAG: hypothetical protein WAL63_15185, partial [Solirubrobacteraceae bacterium]